VAFGTPLITVGGLASGLDTNSLISALLDVARKPIKQLQTQQAALNSQSARLKLIKTKLEALQNAAQALDTPREVLAAKATSSNESIVKATATSGTSFGSVPVIVTSLATAERTYSAPFASKTQTFGAGGSFEIQIGSSNTVISVGPTDTLESLVSKVNGSGARVTASLVYDGNAYRLGITALDTGAANAVTFVEHGTEVQTLALSSAANQVQAAADASFKVDGFPMARASNTVTDAIDGVTLELTGTSASPATVTVARDASAAKSKLETFVTAYNDVMKAIGAEFAYTGKARGADSLSGDPTLRGLQSRLRSLTGQTVAGLTGTYTSLASVGVSTNRDGTLTFDSAKLEAAYSKDPNGVSALLSKGTSGPTGVLSQISTAVDAYTRGGDGSLTVRIDGIAGRVSTLDKQIASMESRIDTYESGLRKQFSELERLMSSLNTQSSQMTSILSQMQKEG